MDNKILVVEVTIGPKGMTSAAVCRGERIKTVDVGYAVGLAIARLQHLADEATGKIKDTMGLRAAEQFVIGLMAGMERDGAAENSRMQIVTNDAKPSRDI